jgi:hypothetical protein
LAVVTQIPKAATGYIPVNVHDVTDTANGSYTLITSVTFGSTIKHSLYYRQNIAAAPKGTNTLTVTFVSLANQCYVRLLEFSGVEPIKNPIDLSSSNSGDGTVAPDTGSVTTNLANDLMFACISTSVTGLTGPGLGWSVANVDTLGAVDEYSINALIQNVYTGTFTGINPDAWVATIVGLIGAIPPSQTVVLNTGAIMHISPLLRYGGVGTLGGKATVNPNANVLHSGQVTI